MQWGHKCMVAGVVVVWKETGGDSKHRLDAGMSGEGRNTYIAIFDYQTMARVAQGDPEPPNLESQAL